MPTLNAVDQSGSRIDPVWAYAHGIRVIYGYLAPGTWKGLDAAYVRRCHAAGIGISAGFEMGAKDAQGGAVAGGRCGAQAKSYMNQLIAQVGYGPKSRLSIPWSFDWDTTPAEYPTLDAAMRAYIAALRPDFDAGDYGEADLIDHFHAVGLVHSGEFGTYAWSKGRVSAYADIQQFANGQTLNGASVDFDTVLNFSGAGVWWPPGHSLDSADATVITPTEEDMPLTPADAALNASTLLNANAGTQTVAAALAQASAASLAAQAEATAVNDRLTELDNVIRDTFNNTAWTQTALTTIQTGLNAIATAVAKIPTTASTTGGVDNTAQLTAVQQAITELSEQLGKFQITGGFGA